MADATPPPNWIGCLLAVPLICLLPSALLWFAALLDDQLRPDQQSELVSALVLALLGMAAIVVGLGIWWGLFKIPPGHVGLTRNEVYAAGWHWHPRGRLLNLVPIDYPSLEKTMSTEMKSAIQTQLSSIDALAAEMGFSFELNIEPLVRDFVVANKEELLLGVANTDPLMSQVTDVANEDLANLRAANAVYLAALAEYEETRIAIHRLGSGSLIRELDTIHDDLFSTKYEEMLRLRRWEDFDEILQGAIEEIRLLRKSAADAKYTEQERTTPTAMTKRKALMLFGLDDDATEEDIKKAYRDAVKKYNVDHRQNLEDHIRILVENKFKEINAAYELLTAPSADSNG